MAIDENLIRSKIRENQYWYRNEKKINLDQAVIKETIRNLKLSKCPVCKGDLSSQDNFGTSLPWNNYSQEGYCPRDNLIIKLGAHEYSGDTSGTALYMEIYTNSLHSKMIAESGMLADISKHVNLISPPLI